MLWSLCAVVFLACSLQLAVVLFKSTISSLQQGGLAGWDVAWFKAAGGAAAAIPHCSAAVLVVLPACLAIQAASPVSPPWNSRLHLLTQWPHALPPCCRCRGRRLSGSGTTATARQRRRRSGRGRWAFIRGRGWCLEEGSVVLATLGHCLATAGKRRGRAVGGSCVLLGWCRAVCSAAPANSREQSSGTGGGAAACGCASACTCARGGAQGSLVTDPLCLTCLPTCNLVWPPGGGAGRAAAAADSAGAGWAGQGQGWAGVAPQWRPQHAWAGCMQGHAPCLHARMMASATHTHHLSAHHPLHPVLLPITPTRRASTTSTSRWRPRCHRRPRRPSLRTDQAWMRACARSYPRADAADQPGCKAQHLTLP